MTIDPHGPNELRCNGTLSNVAEFHEVSNFFLLLVCVLCLITPFILNRHLMYNQLIKCLDQNLNVLIFGKGVV